MEIELTAEERLKHILVEAESFARFITVEGQRQRRSKAAVYIAVAYLAGVYAESDPELWQDALKAFSLKKDQVQQKQERVS